ncbi:MAG: N-acetylmuramoyl-L-alanine amidase [Kouleothrix sp.]|nr:N-acetylmuramoyl-L-alanine amidase [Kouleothrix sp.]
MIATVRSPNYGARGGRDIAMLVVHATAGSLRGALAWLTNAAARVSAHYLIDKQGQVYQLVPDELAAWHAGRAGWRGETAINEISLGIELENANDGRDPYPAGQVDALLRLARDKVARYQIAPAMVVRHRDVAQPPGRKSDPAGFPWAEFIRQLFPQQPASPDERPPRPPSPGDGPVGLARALRAEAYRQVGATDRPEWAMHRLARAEGLGLPVGPSFELAVAGRAYIAQPFGRETLLSPIGDWQRVVRQAALAAPEQQPLREALTQAVYAQAGETYRPGWALHQYAERAPLGPPLGPGWRVGAAGQDYVAACYALDTIFSPAGSWREIARLSELLARPAAGPKSALAEALQEQLYRRAGSRLRADWQIHRYALAQSLGAPLGPSFRVALDGRDYVAEAFALDVAYCEVGDWKSIARLGALPG